MPNKSAAKKYLKVSKKKNIRNTQIKKKLKSSIKEFKDNLKQGADVKKIEPIIKTAIKTIDKAAQKKVIKKNTAARKKSRLQKKFNALSKK